MRSSFIIAVTISFAMGVPPALGHHGFTPHFDRDNIVTVEGTVIEFQYRNPHSFLLLEVSGATGAPEAWTCEMSPATLLKRQGFSGDLFQEGEQLTVLGPAARREARRCRVFTATRSNGSVVQLQGGDIPHVSVEAAPAHASIFGDWMTLTAAQTIRADRVFPTQVGPNPFEEQLTDTGRAAHAGYDPLTDDPTLMCNPSSPWRTWGSSPGSPIRIERQGNVVNIRYEWMDVLREVHLDMDSHPEDVPPSPLGHSIGRLDGDALVMETTAFSSGVFLPHPGVLMSPDAHLTERVFLADNGQLRVTWQLHDPAYFTEPLIGDFLLESTDIPFERFDCDTERH